MSVPPMLTEAVSSRSRASMSEKSISASNVLGTLERHILLDGFKVVIDLEKSRGPYIYNAVHGRTGYTMSLTNTDPRKTDLFAKFDWPRVSCPHIDYSLPESKRQGDVIAREKKCEEEIRDKIDKNKIDICAIIIEPIQGEGGDNHFRGEWLQMLRKIC